MAWDRRTWASLSPTGLRETKPRHFREMARIVWENRGELPFAWRILTKGVCDGCALGTTGMRDWTIEGTHLCMVRLELLSLNTMGALDPARLADVARLGSLTSGELRELGRLPEPMVRRRGEPGFRVIGWDEAIDLAAERLRGTKAERVALYLTSRGIPNETYYVAQKAARFLGTNHVDNSARLCHAASTVAMKGMLGHGASTTSYRDWLHADLIVFFGSNVPNNQPVTTKYLYHAKKNGAAIAVVNPYREPGLEQYWVPSVLESALFGTKLADHWFDVDTGRPEWEVFGEVCARARPDRAEKIRFGSTREIREEIARAIPLYAGIEKLGLRGESVQWGGETLYADGVFATPDGKARFARVALPSRKVRDGLDGLFHVSTRRGKQFNSMVQRGFDPLTGAARRDVLMSKEDAGRLSFPDGASIRLVSDSGEFRGFVKVAPIKAGNLEVHWPEGLPLLSASEVDPESGEPDYNALVRVERI